MLETTLEFDQWGYLIPYDIVAVEWNTFVSHFSTNAHRRDLLVAYENFLNDLAVLLPVKHRHWIDGSFVSQKQMPGDIDVIVFVPHSHFAILENELRLLKNRVKGAIDCYFVKSVTPDHPNYEICLADELDWYHFLHADRRKRPKGILEIWFDYGD